MKEYNWLSLHLYTIWDFDHFINNAIIPVIETLEHRFGIGEFFFIRYFDKGPHIRLRIRGTGEQLKCEIEPYLRRYFLSYFKQHPSDDIAYHRLSGNAPDILPNDSLHLARYVPEYSRYGEQLGVDLAERLFILSSKTVFRWLKGRIPIDYGERIGIAMKMHVVFIYHVLGFKEGLQQLQSTEETWFGKAKRFTEGNRQRTLSSEEVLAAFEQSFQSNKENMMEVISHIWCSLEEGTNMEEVWLDQWSQGLKEFENVLEANCTNILSNITLFFADADGCGEGKSMHKKRFLVDSYIHMTNNRLGILNRDESFVAYLLRRTLQTLNEKVLLR